MWTKKRVVNAQNFCHDSPGYELIDETLTTLGHIMLCKWTKKMPSKQTVVNTSCRENTSCSQNAKQENYSEDDDGQGNERATWRSGENFGLRVTRSEFLFWFRQWFFISSWIISMSAWKNQWTFLSTRPNIAMYSFLVKSRNIYFPKILFIFKERGREGQKQGKKHQCTRETSISCHSHAPNLVHNPGMCPERESNQCPFSSQVGSQSTEPHQPEQEYVFFS